MKEYNSQFALSVGCLFVNSLTEKQGFVHVGVTLTISQVFTIENTLAAFKTNQ